MRRLLCASLVLGVGGCASFSNHLTPLPSEPGQVELGAAVGVIGGARGTGTRAVVVNPEVRVRVGLFDRVDFGGKISLLGAELSSRIGLLEGPLDLGLAPAVGIAFSTITSEEVESLVFTAKLPLLAGVEIGDVVSLVFGPTGVLVRSGDGDVLLYPGGTLGVNLQIVDWFAIFPEVNLFVPYHINLERWRKPVVQGGLAVAITFGD